MEMINDWVKKRPPAPGTNGAPRQTPPVDDIRERLENIRPPILTVHCYEDVGYPWVQVAFDEMIGPGVALEVGDALAGLAGASHVYLNSLRPKAVYFLLKPAFDPEQKLDAERYGAKLEEVKKAWAQNGVRANVTAQQRARK